MSLLKKNSARVDAELQSTAASRAAADRIRSAIRDLEVVATEEPIPKDGQLPLSTPCWCLKTHEPVGPDGEGVTVDDCVAPRACYRPEVDLQT